MEYCYQTTGKSKNINHIIFQSITIHITKTPLSPIPSPLTISLVQVAASENEEEFSLQIRALPTTIDKANGDERLNNEDIASVRIGEIPVGRFSGGVLGDNYPPLPVITFSHSPLSIQVF